MLSPPLPRADSDLRFEFVAERRDGRQVPSLLTISLPAALPDGRDFYCTVTMSGFVETAENAYGATRLQALQLSTRMARYVLAAYEPEWVFLFDGDEQMDFTALNDPDFRPTND